jgi:hypothetical protein
MQKVSRSILAGALVLAGLTACGDKISTGTQTSTTPPAAVVHSVTVTPASVSLSIGQNVTLVAQVNADAGLARTVTWASTNAAVATVSSAGVVQAVASGTAVITATSTADPTVAGAASIIVAPITLASVSIASINVTTGAGSVPANLAAVAGQVNVTLNVDPGTQNVTTVNLITNNGVRDTIVASETGLSLSRVHTVGNASGVVSSIQLSFNTANFNPATGAVSFPNGPETMKASLAITGASGLTVSNTLTYTLANVDFICVGSALCPTAKVVGAVGPVTAASGLAWFGGAVTVTVIPVIYTPGVYDSVVVVQADTGAAGAGLAIAGASKTLTGSATPGLLTATFATTGAGNIGGVSSGNFGVNITTAYSGGGAGPVLGTSFTPAAVIRLDNVAPMTPTAVGIRGTDIAYVVSPGPSTFNGPFATTWVNGAYAFGAADFKTANGDSVPALALLAGNFAVGQASGSSGLGVIKTYAWPKATFTPLGAAFKTGAACSTTGGTLVATGSQLAQSAPDDSTTYNLRYFQFDIVGNVTCVDLGGTVPTTFGVDLTPPVSVAYSAALGSNGLNNGLDVVPAGNNFAYNAADLGNLVITGVDSISGFSATPVSMSTLRTIAAVGGVNPGTFHCDVGVVATNVCKSPATGLGLTNLTVPAANTEGYYVINASISDKAGNAVALTPANFLVAVDRTPPSAIGGVAVPAALVGGQPVSLTANVIDNLTLFSTSGSVVYTLAAPGAANTAINYGGSVTGSPVFGTINASATATLTVPVFISSAQQMSAAGAPTNPSVLPTGANLRGVDEVGLAGGFQAAAGAVNINPNNNIVTGTGNGSTVGAGVTAGDWAVADFSTFGSGPGAATTICNAANVAACVAHPSTITLTDSVVTPPAKGLPFSQVCWYYLNPQAAQTAIAPTYVAEYVQIGCQSSAAVTASALQNTWVYTGPAWRPPATLVTPANIIVIGFGVNGHAAITAPNLNIILAGT